MEQPMTLEEQKSAIAKAHLFRPTLWDQLKPHAMLWGIGCALAALPCSLLLGIYFIADVVSSGR